MSKEKVSVGDGSVFEGKSQNNSSKFKIVIRLEFIYLLD